MLPLPFAACFAYACCGTVTVLMRAGHNPCVCRIRRCRHIADARLHAGETAGLTARECRCQLLVELLVAFGKAQIVEARGLHACRLYTTLVDMVLTCSTASGMRISVQVVALYAVIRKVAASCFVAIGTGCASIHYES